MDNDYVHTAISFPFGIGPYITKVFHENLALVHYFLSFLEFFFYQFGPKNGQNLPENARFLHGMRNTAEKYNMQISFLEKCIK